MERKTKDKSGKHNKIFVILWIGALFVNIKSIFADFDVDASYALSTAYRNIMGDRMFSQMLEPHQTSAFLPEIFMIPFYKITGGFDGIVIYLQIIGVLLFAAVTFVLYRVLIKKLSYEVTNLICIFFFTARPKHLVFPEFSNMLILFSVLLFCAIIESIQHQQEKKYIIAAAVLMCMGVLAYPSFLLAYPVVVLIIALYHDESVKKIILFTSVCALAALMYVSYFCICVGAEGFVQGLISIVAGDSSHAGNTMSLFYYFEATVKGIVWIGICCVPAFAVYFLKRSKNAFFIALGILLNVSYLAIYLYFSIKYGSANNAWYLIFYTVYLLIILLGAVGIKKCTDNDKKIYVIGMLISAAAFAAVVLLTNGSLVTMLPYMIPAVMVSFIPAAELNGGKSKIAFLVMFSVLVMMHRGVTTKDLYSWENDILHVRRVITEGPAKGIVCSYMGYYQNMETFNDCIQYLKEEDSLLVVGEGFVNSITYMYVPVEISHYSTISTPTYDENLFKYWEEYPEKTPTVVAVECWYGNLAVAEDSPIMQWVNEHCTEYVDGSYWRFYR
jgi:hypothetical protein